MSQPSDRNIRVSHDAKADAVYISLREIGVGEVANTVPSDPQQVDGMINLDFDDEDRLVGIEILDAKSKLPRELLESVAVPGSSTFTPHLTIALISPPHRDHIVASIAAVLGNRQEQIAEVYFYAGQLRVEVYSPRDADGWTLNHQDLLQALAKAAAHLEERR
ncbi:MAG: DUF2283 domain-containing protein [bacterium]|nr:DUF2283 domain-containing protein [bacterium]